MPDELDQLIAQQQARQGRPLAAVPANAGARKPGPLDALLDSFFGDASPADRGMAANQLTKGTPPSEVVGNVYGRQGDIELPPMNPSLPPSLAALQNANTRGTR